MKVNSWQDFLDKIRFVKKHKIKTPPAPVIFKLIYAGAFDSIIPVKNIKNIHEYYRKMCDDVSNVLKSKAQLPKASKTQTIGVADIDSEVKLYQWRSEINPTFTFNLTDLYKGHLLSLGYLPFNTQDPRYKPIKYIKEVKYNQHYIEKTVLMESWNDFWSLPDDILFKQFLSDGCSYNGIHYKYFVSFIGFISNIEERVYGKESKEMIKVKLYLGKDHTNYLVQWPDKTGKIKEENRKKITLNRPVLVSIRANISNGRFKGGSIQDIHAFTV